MRKASEKLRVSQPSISAQIRELETAFGEPLFRRSGRQNILTDAGQIALRYADEIFALGSELVNAIKSRPGAKAIRLYVGVADSFPKLLTNDIIRPALSMSQPVHVICREGKQEDLLAQLASHRLDIVLTDEPASSSQNLRTFNHLLGESVVAFCAASELAATLKRKFPKSLHRAPALLPAESTPLRRSLEQWFRNCGVVPQVVAEFEDAALMKVMAADGRGVVPIPKVVLEEAQSRYGLELIGFAEECRDRYYAVTAERRITHPAVANLTAGAAQLLKT